MKPEEFSEESRHAVCRTAARIARDVWRVTDEEAAAIFATKASEITNWHAGAPAASITDKQLWRISYILGIHAALTTLVPDKGQHAHFIHQPVPRLDGRSPLEVMRHEKGGLRRVRRWLDSECQW